MYLGASSLSPTYFGLSARTTFRFSALVLMVCMKWSRLQVAGLVE